MPARDAAQLILEVDARIAAAQRAVNQLARSIQKDADGMGDSLDRVAKHHERLGKTVANNNNRLRSGFTQLSFQIGDVSQQMSLGVSASRIFAQQSGQVIQALQVMGGEGNKFLQFMGGPWGIAIATAAVVLGPLASKLFETGDEVGNLVDKMREQAKQAALNKQADEAWKQTIEGLTEAIRKRREEQEKARKSDVRAEVESFQEAEGQLLGQAEHLEKKKRELDAANAALQRQRADLTAAGDSDPAQVSAKAAAIADAEATVKRLAGEVVALQRAVLDSMKALLGEQASLLTRQAEHAVDPLKKTADQIALDIDQLTGKFIAGQVGPAAYRKEIERLTRALKDAKDAGKGAGKVLTDFISPVEGPIRGKFGEKRPGHQHAGIDIKVPVGTPVKAPAGGVVIEAGVVGDYGNVIFIDHGGGTISRLAHLSKLSAVKGQTVAQGDIVGLSGGAKGAPGSGNSQGPHVHQEIRVGGKPVDPLKGKFATDSAAAALRGGRAAESAAEKALRQQNAFEEQRERLNEELLRAQAELVQGVDAEADFAVEMLKIAQQRRDAAIQNDVEEGKLTQAQADELKAINARITYQKAKSVEVQRQLQRMQRQSELEQRSFAYQIDDLRFADEMARTAAEHRRLQLQILDVVYQEKEAALRALKARLELAGKIEEAADVQAQIDRLPTTYAQDRARVFEGTKNPLEAWMDGFSADQVIEDFQRIQVEGLDSLASAITNVIMGTQSLGEAFSNVARQIIADIIQMTIRMLIFRAISAALGGLGGAPPLPGGLSDGSNALFGNLFGGPRAAGGPVSGGKAYLVGERGPELFVPGSSGTIIPNAPRLSGMGAAANSNAPIEVMISFAPSPELMPIIESVSARQIGRAAPMIVRAAVDTTMRAAKRPKLMGRG